MPVPHVTLAYIDPGSGSLIIQVVIAAIVATPIFFRKQIGRVVALVRGRRGEPRGTVRKPDAD